MYKMIIVDDDEIEREGMTEFISWEKYGIEIVGDAWNGEEGYKIICSERPDIVITDIKMPVMNGIQLIQKVKGIFPETLFVILSGYGEYEFTSQAMEMGIRHYVLKPCDEKKIVSVIEKVKEELKKQQEVKKAKNEMLPKAKAQFFRDALLSEALSEEKIEFYKKAFQIGEKVCLLSVKTREENSYLNRFVIQNILEELLGETVLSKTEISQESLFLLKESSQKEIENSVEKLRREYRHFGEMTIRYALSNAGEFSHIRELYEQVKGIYAFEGKETDILAIENEELLREFQRIEQIRKVEEFLMELSVFFARFRLWHKQEADMSKVGNYLINYLTDGKVDWSLGDTEGSNQMDIFQKAVETMKKRGWLRDKKSGTEKVRMEQILIAVYSNISQRNLSLQWLAAEVFFMNEEHLGRLFLRSQKEKFSDYVLKIRMELAKRLIEYMPNIRVSELAESVGYSADGQYFGKTFRKYVGMKPSEYKEHMIKEKG